MEESQKLQEKNQQLQMQSAQQAQQQAARLQQEKLEAERAMEEFRSTKKKEELLLTGVLAVAAKDETGALIKQFLPAIQQLVPNITVPLVIETRKMQEQIIQEEQAKQQQLQMQEQLSQMSPEEQQQLMQQQVS